MNCPVKHPLLCLAVVCTAAVFLETAQSQDASSEPKQIMASGGSWRNVFLTATSIERGARYPSVIRLKGSVQIKMKGMILRADEGEFHEGTGEIDARGNVRIVPYPIVEEGAGAAK